MQVRKAIERRKSTREFSNKKISYKILSLIRDMAYKIPSAGNLKPLELYMVVLKKIPIGQPPVYLIICADFKKTTIKYGKRGEDYVYMEAGHMAQNICLMCEDLGLGSCCIGALDREATKKKFKLEYLPIYSIGIGYKCK